MTNRYDDILYLPHKQSDARQRMSRASRAAQFAPFAALVGYGDALNETMRKTEEKIDLSDDQIPIPMERQPIAWTITLSSTEIALMIVISVDTKNKDLLKKSMALPFTTR